MFGDNLGMEYYRQRHEELVQRSERARLAHRLEMSARAERAQRGAVSLHRRVLAAAGGQLVRFGNRLQSVGDIGGGETWSRG